MNVGRFQVMAILQAARARELGLSEREAKSWGLNRAIFYAAAKRGFKHKAQGSTPRGRAEGKRASTSGKAYLLGNEMAYTTKRNSRRYFTIGGKPQTEQDFARQIEARFGEHFGQAWKESRSIIHLYPKEILLSQNRFFAEVYRPRRDDLAAKWTALSE
jgi:hypothetical protein